VGTQVLYARNDDGEYDSTSNTYRDPQVALQVKYPKEVRLLLGVACVKESNGEERGIRMDLLDYTEKKVISLKDTKKIIDEEIKRVRTMPKKTKGWFVDSREDGMLHADDPVSRVKGIGKKVEELLRGNGIKTIANLLALTEETRSDGLTAKALERYRGNCQHASSENAPLVTYFTEADNPYAARYGDEKDEWGVGSARVDISDKKLRTFCSPSLHY
jgi:hypothetical protein